MNPKKAVAMKIIRNMINRLQLNKLLVEYRNMLERCKQISNFSAPNSIILG